MSGRRGGFVLAVVLFAIVLLAAMAAGGFYAALQEVRAGRNAQSLERTRGAAEAAAWSVVVQWDPRVLDGVAVGTLVAESPTPQPGLSVAASVRRLSERLFLVQANATTAGGASSSVMTVMRLWLPETMPAAVRTRAVGSGLSGFATGVDQAPPGRNCPAMTGSVPAAVVQPLAPDSIFLMFGAMNWAALIAWIGAVPPGGDSLIVRYEPGDAILSGGRTMGLLVVEGDLTLTSGASHLGLVLVRGTVRLDGAGGTVTGAMVASQVIAANGYTPVQPAVRYSSRAVQLASGSRALPVTLHGFPASRFF